MNKLKTLTGIGIMALAAAGAFAQEKGTAVQNDGITSIQEMRKYEALGTAAWLAAVDRGEVTPSNAAPENETVPGVKQMFLTQDGAGIFPKIKSPDDPYWIIYDDMLAFLRKENVFTAERSDDFRDKANDIAKTWGLSGNDVQHREYVLGYVRGEIKETVKRCLEQFPKHVINYVIRYDYSDDARTVTDILVKYTIDGYDEDYRQNMLNPISALQPEQPEQVR